MEKILDLTNDFDIECFDTIVEKALGPNNSQKLEAEQILLKFKNLNNSWTKVDFILKNSKSQQSRFIALQILEENVKTKWSIFNESIKGGIRQYIFSYIVNNSNLSSNDIILQKFNVILVDIVKRDWPKKWPNFITDIISIAQSTSMEVCTNVLLILKLVNEQIFLYNDDLTTAKKRFLQSSLQNEYLTIFNFLMNILEYSETQNLDIQLLKNCLNCFGSFCKTIHPENVFSTKIIEIICKHLNSAHSIEVLQVFLEIIDLFSIKADDGELIQISIPKEFDTNIIYKKINYIHCELLGFFDLYMKKFDNDIELAKTFSKFDQNEQLFIKSYARCFCALYFNYFAILNVEETKRGLLHLTSISRINNIDLFREIFPTWRFIIYNFYSEYPMHTKTLKPLKRTQFLFILNKLLPILINFMPRPQEVFVVINDLGEVIKDKNVQTVEIEFCKKMKENFQYMCFCIKDDMIKYLINECQKHLKMIRSFDPVYFNKLCWTIGSLANTLDHQEEKEFFINFMDIILSLCEYITQFELKAIVASDIMFLIGQYQRFLKNNLEFTFVSISKLFEFMEEEFEGIKEMACDNFLKIAENCPMQFFKKLNGKILFDNIIIQLPQIRSNLDFILQRTFIEGLFIILKSNKIQNEGYVNQILVSFIDQESIKFNAKNVSDIDGIKKVCHMFECYTLGFDIIPEILKNICNKTDVIQFYIELTRNQNIVSNYLLKIIKESIIKLFIKIVKIDNDNNFYNSIIETVLLDYKNTMYSLIIELGRLILENSTQDFYTRRVLFVITNIIIPSIPLVMEGDNNPDVSIEFIQLNKTLIETNQLYNINFPILFSNDQFPKIYQALLSTLGCMKEISDKTLLYLLHLFRISFESKNYQFFNAYFFITFENIIGLIIDKDTIQNHNLQIELFYESILISQQIPPMTGQSNHKAVSDFIKNLFINTFKNITENTLTLFIRGIFEIKNRQCFMEHVDDFKVKIYEYGTDEDLNVELDILQERINAI